jgi:hypothetical protein
MVAWTAWLPAAALGLLVLSVPAFWPTYLSRPLAADPYTHAHALLGTLWLLVLMAQPRLVAGRRLGLHRRLGWAAVALGVALVVSSVLLTHHRVSRLDAATFARDGAGFYLPLVMAALFASALVLAVRWRRVTALHARYMACTLLALIDPVIARLLAMWGPSMPAADLYQAPAFLVIVTLIGAMARTLPAHSRGQSTFSWFAWAVTAALLFNIAAPHVAPWSWWMQWFRDLPLT